MFIVKKILLRFQLSQLKLVLFVSYLYYSLYRPPGVIVEEESNIFPVFRVAFVYLIPLRIVCFQTTIPAQSRICILIYVFSHLFIIPQNLKNYKKSLFTKSEYFSNVYDTYIRE